MSVFGFGEKVPVPALVQVPLPVEEVPLRATTLLLAQTVRLLPAFTVGIGVKNIFTVSFTALQVPLLVEVRMRFRLPAATSAALGTKVVVSTVAEGVKVPVPAVVQVPLPVEE